ncbi:conserved hypothetical protein [Candidatus Sulfopaludibacter sp. SbA4]|nr:conserved hypothetical protein [Candidatus Sulfopaludibacter sp. SbA4]
MKLYEADFYRWTQETSDRLRRGEFGEIDLVTLVEEVEDLGRREKNALESRLSVLICHLLKWDLQPGKRSKSWQATIALQRSRIERLLKQSPSLRPYLREVLPEAYTEAVLRAIKETGFDSKTFAETCPYHVEEILSTKDVSVNC